MSIVIIVWHWEDFYKVNKLYSKSVSFTFLTLLDRLSLIFFSHFFLFLFIFYFSIFMPYNFFSHQCLCIFSPNRTDLLFSLPLFLPLFLPLSVLQLGQAKHWQLSIFPFTPLTFHRYIKYGKHFNGFFMLPSLVFCILYFLLV